MLGIWLASAAVAAALAADAAGATAAEFGAAADPSGQSIDGGTGYTAGPCREDAAHFLGFLGRAEAGEGNGRDLSALMPHARDYTHLWWSDGFPGHTPGAPWQRCIQTGYYALVLDTEALQIPHFGSLVRDSSYAAVGRADNSAWQNLPPAQLELSLVVGGKRYRCTSGGKWTQFTGPRIIESGHFLQRADVTDLVFAAEDGEKLNVEARFETVAWPDRLGLILAARPGLKPIPAGETCFGRLGGGFGLDGTNHLEIPHAPELDPQQFTLELWAFVPTDYQASPRTFPWLVCKNRHEQADGNYGIVIVNGRPQARMNIGGGHDNEFSVTAEHPLVTDAWNHLALSYDGDTLRFYINGSSGGEQKIGRRRAPGRDGLAFGRRQDNCGDGYHFRGVVDELRFYQRALTSEEIRQRYQKPETPLAALRPARSWTFRVDGISSRTRPGEQWRQATLAIGLSTGKGKLHQQWELPKGQTWTTADWHEAFLAVDPISSTAAEATSPVCVAATEIPCGTQRPVDYDPSRGWHRVNLDGIEPIFPSGGQQRLNDVIERVRLQLSNPTDREQIARLLLEKNGSGIRHRFGAAITGMSAVLRDADGQPIGIPVQLSKNWHNRPQGGVYADTWFHGFTQVRLPARASIALELTLAYGHWGGVAAASHAQLCLVGWGSNQLWDQSALGSWGESICYEPDEVQAHCSILDVRPVMVRSMANDQHWTWTHNVGGGDFFRLFDADGQRVPHARMRTSYVRQGPCLTEVTYAGRIGEGIEHAATVSLARTDDIVRGTYRLRLHVKRATDFSRLVIFQIGADTYSYTGERKIALGNESGLAREWATQWGGDTYRTQPMECAGRIPWISLHEAVARRQRSEKGAGANRGIVVRAWNARLGGRDVTPWAAEHGVKARGTDTSTIDIIPPPGVARLEPGDFVDATIEHVIVPQFAADYYGPNQSLRAALETWENTWRMIHREATANDRRVAVSTGKLEGLYPAIAVRAKDDRAEFTLTGGLGYVPVTFSGLTSWADQQVRLDGRVMDQSVHGNDFWQTDYDPVTRCWSRTYNLPVEDQQPHTIRLEKAEPSRPRMLFGDDTRHGRPFAKDPSVIRFGGRYLLYYSMAPSANKSLPRGWAIGIAESGDLVQWRKIGEILPEQECEQNGIVNGRIILLDNKLHLFYNTYGNGAKDSLCHATSTDGLHFTRNPTNPIWAPTGAWNNGRAIDVDVVEWDGRLIQYYATRDPAGKVQMLHAIAADRKSGFGRGDWKSLIDGPILKPELPWEKKCIEAPSVFRRGDTLYLFYGGGYNNDPQQVGCAVSKDGVHFRRLFQEPLIPNGGPADWNASETGHPGVFEDVDGRTYLFVQGNNDRGRTWFISCYEIGWEKALPVVRWDSVKFPMKRPDIPVIR